MIERVQSSVGRESNRYASRGVEQKSMLNTNAYVGIEEREEILSEAGVAQQLEQILASGPPSLYRRQ